MSTAKCRLSTRLWDSIRTGLANETNLPPWVARVFQAPLADALAQGIKIQAYRQCVTDSYLEFLCGQIARDVRGPEWSQVLRNRLAAMTPYKGKAIVSVMMIQGDNEFTAYLTAGRSPKVINYEAALEQKERWL